MERAEQTAVFQRLFEEAESRGSLEYFFTLVRVDGLSFGVRDPLLRVQDVLETPRPTDLAQIRSRYCELASAREPLELIANLLNCTGNRPYTPSPFHHLYSGEFPNITAPKPIVVLKDLVCRATDRGQADLVAMLEAAYPEQAIHACPEGEIAEA